MWELISFEGTRWQDPICWKVLPYIPVEGLPTLSSRLCFLPHVPALQAFTATGPPMKTLTPSPFRHNVLTPRLPSEHAPLDLGHLWSWWTLPSPFVLVSKSD